MSISYDATSCAKLKYIVNFGFEDNFIDRECLMIDTKQAVNTLKFAKLFFFV